MQKRGRPIEACTGGIEPPNELQRDVAHALAVTAVVAECIAALGEVPSGHLYAQVMDRMSLETYTKILALLKKAELVEEHAHVLRWIGPVGKDGARAL